jgi:hypothetical protein
MRSYLVLACLALLAGLAFADHYSAGLNSESSCLMVLACCLLGPMSLFPVLLAALSQPYVTHTCLQLLARGCDVPPFFASFLCRPQAAVGDQRPGRC